MKVAVIGLGYVGLIQAACLAKLGHEVLGIDIDEERLLKLQSGELPFYEPGLESVLRETEGRFMCTGQLRDIVAFGADIVFVCLPTPPTADGACDVSYVVSAVRELSRILERKTLVVLKSTVPPTIMEQLSNVGPNMELASAPEFLREGKAVSDFFNPDRLVFGVQSEWAERLLREVHAQIEAPVFVMSPESAQLSKYASNSMLAMRLSFMNELANIADVVGADIADVTRVVGSDSRIGSSFLRAGAGFGGSCFPKDVLALAHAARQRGYDSQLIDPIISVNKKQAHLFVDRLKSHLGDLSKYHFAVLGLAFNAETDDLRESPAIRIIDLLLAEGSQITAYDPAALQAASYYFGDKITLAQSAQDTLNSGPGALLVLTEWPEFSELDWSLVARSLRIRAVFDGKNFLPREKIEQEGLHYCGLGLCDGPSRHLGN